MGIDSCAHKTGSTSFRAWKLFCSTPGVDWMSQSSPEVSEELPIAFVLNNSNTKKQLADVQQRAGVVHCHVKQKRVPLNQGPGEP